MRSRESYRTATQDNLLRNYLQVAGFRIFITVLFRQSAEVFRDRAFESKHKKIPKTLLNGINLRPLLAGGRKKICKGNIPIMKLS